jgi:hypothetical protein
MVIGEFNLAGIVAGLMLFLVIIGCAWLSNEYAKFKEETKKITAWWER